MIHTVRKVLESSEYRGTKERAGVGLGKGRGKREVGFCSTLISTLFPPSVACTILVRLLESRRVRYKYLLCRRVLLLTSA